jgi:hypothetical protein
MIMEVLEKKGASYLIRGSEKFLGGRLPGIQRLPA